MRQLRIDIGTVLNKFDDIIDQRTQTAKTYGIRYMKKDGTVKEIMNARKNVKDPNRQLEKSGQEGGRRMFHLKFHGVMLAYDQDKDEYRSVKTAHLFQFRDYQSNRWLDIFH